MQIWLTRHGQTDLNKKRRMQGRSDIPLNETGLEQARQMRRLLEEAYPGLHFDAVYASPLRRAVVTASVIGGVPEEDVLTDERLLETDFGRYERRKYYLMGPAMSAYWALPERFRAPATVESVASMTERAAGFLWELEQTGFEKGYENVLVACHGGILRALCGYMADRPDGILWRPKPHNCEVRIYASMPADSPAGDGRASDGPDRDGPAGFSHSHVRTFKLKK